MTLAWQSGMVMLILASSVSARDRESHIPILSSTDGLTPAQILQQKFGDPDANQVVRDLLRELNLNDLRIDPKLRDELMRNPATADVLRRLRDGDEQILRLVEQMASTYRELKGIDRAELRGKAAELARQYTAGRGRAQGHLMPPIPEQSAQQIYNEQINDLLRDWKLEGIAEQLRDSPAFRDLLQEMSRTKFQPSFLSSGINPRLFDLKAFSNLLNNLRAHLPKNLSNLRSPLSATNLPNISFGRPSMPGISSPGFGEGWSAIICVIMVGLAFALVWKVLRWTPPSARADRRWKRQLDLDNVNSWPELIRAYEGIALNRFGPDAAHWNHRRVATQLTSVAPSNDVDTVAALYEQGRYAPTLAANPPWEPIRAALHRLAEGRP